MSTRRLTTIIILGAISLTKWNSSQAIEFGSVQALFELRITAQREFDWSEEQVWSLIAGFDSLDDYYPAITQSHLHNNGLVRYLNITDTGVDGGVVEQTQSIDRSNVKVSLHLCHEIRHGNAESIEDIITNSIPHLAYPSICGSYNWKEQSVDNDKSGKDRQDSIMPLDSGSYDASRMVDTLVKNNFTGPIILHTFGLKNISFDHHLRSIQTLRNMEIAALKHIE